MKLTMYFLASSAMAELGVQWLFPAQLVLNLAAVTTGFVADFEIGVVLMDLVRCSKFPLIKVSLRAAIVPIIAIRSVGRSVRHVLGTCVKLYLVEP